MCLPSNHRLLLRTAQVLQQQYARLRQTAALPVIPIDRISQIYQQVHRLELATRRELSAATQHGRGELRDGIRWLIHDLTQCQESLRRAVQISAVPPLRLLYDELASLTEEFEEVQIELRERRITVYTLPIVLEDMDLGPFEIRLNLREIGERAAYEVIAVDPQSSGSGHAHPHVSGTTLCEGDGGRVLARALDEGRISEFFVIVRQILETYNADSAYERLDSWHGVSCSACGDSTSDDDHGTCEGCDCDLCGDCSRNCLSCGNTLCYDCAHTCEGCDHDHCRSCLKRCEDCLESYCEACLTDGRCASCLESTHTTGDEDAEDVSSESIETESPDADTAFHSTEAAVQPDRVGEAALSA
jgi:hypothetical protein